MIDEPLTVEQAHIRELTRQRDILAAQVVEMRALIQEIPLITMNARLDAKEGKQTVYDYTRAGRACEVRVA